MRTTDRDLMKTAGRTDVGNQRVEAAAAVAVADEVTTEAIDTVKENHAVSLQQEDANSATNAISAMSLFIELGDTQASIHVYTITAI